MSPVRIDPDKLREQTNWDPNDPVRSAHMRRGIRLACLVGLLILPTIYVVQNSSPAVWIVILLLLLVLFVVAVRAIRAATR